MSGIFISYRRGDSQGSAGRLFDDLKERFPQEQIFIDVDSIAIGEDFQDAIERYVTSCHVQLVVIGPDWLGARGSKTAPRLHDADDFVHIEVKAALERKIPVVPILVQGANMPRKEDLPDALERLVRRNAVELRHTRWNDDVKELMNALERMPRPETPRGEPLLETQRPRESPAVSALMQRLLTASSAHELESIAFEVDALVRERPNDIEVVRLKRKVQDAMRAERPAPRGAAEPRAFSRRPLLAAAAGIVAVMGGLLVYQVSRTPDSIPADDSPVVVPPPDTEPGPVEPPKPADTRYRLPDFLGQTLDAAQSELASAELKVDARGEESKRTAGTILRQQPAAGAEMAKGDVVTLVFATPIQARMPKLLGLDVRSAMERAKENGLVVARRESVLTFKGGHLTVIRQDPPAGDVIKEGQEIMFWYAVAPDTCIRGYVWRDAFPGDHVCVTPETAEQTKVDNTVAEKRRAGRGAYGPDTCVSGFVWRAARPEDLVCVTPATRDQAAADNAAAADRTVAAIKR